jgi:myosin heavy subunit
MNFIRNLASELLDDQEAFTDLTMVSVADADACHSVLSKRYAKDEIYTFCGPLLVAVNPYRELPALYTAGSLDQHAQLLPSDGEPPPHAFAMAARAHARLMQEGRDQAIVISGESGAGKTETAKFLLQYLARVASAGEETLQVRAWPPPPPPPPPCRRHRRRRRRHRRHHHHHLLHHPPMQARVMGSNPIMESFGCAQTVRNDNSSRFGTSCRAPHTTAASRAP